MTTPQPTVHVMPTANVWAGRPAERLTSLDQLKKHIRTLASLDESTVPILNCYLNLEDRSRDHSAVFDRRVNIIADTLRGRTRDAFEDALTLPRYYLRNELLPEARGVAIFSRAYGDDGRLFLPLQFAVPVPDWISLYPVPNLYHLVELKDNYDRYVLVFAARNNVRIMVVSLGSVTEQVWLERPASRQRVGAGWSRTHYHARRHEEKCLFLSEAVVAIGELMKAGGHTHLILAGLPEVTAAIRGVLPKTMTGQLIDSVAAGEHHHISDVVAATLAAFIDREEHESRTIAAQLIDQVRADGLGVVGLHECHNALKQGQADTLVMTNTFGAEIGWTCVACDALHIGSKPKSTCLTCGGTSLRFIELGAELVREAEQHDCHVEMVQHSDSLDALGGVGCLLRRRP